jgi:catechol 2,3-dioxygenase-like lactoylglutathione lyase family enzyme
VDIAFNHVGIGVADIQAGVSFYVSVFGCRTIVLHFDVRADSIEGIQAVDVLKPPEFGRMMMAHLAMPDGVGIELFQLIDPPHEPRMPQLEYWKSGVFHLCVTSHDIEKLRDLIVAHGGRQLSKIWVNRQPDMTMVYCADPWGTIIEVYSNTYLEMYSR